MEVASVKAMIAEVTREIEDSQRDIFDLRQEITPEGHRGIEEERRRVEEWNASIRKERKEEKLKLKWRIVAGEVVGYVRRMKCTKCRWHTKRGIVAGKVIGRVRVRRTQCAECRWHTMP